jgi:hypothetical protein
MDEYMAIPAGMPWRGNKNLKAGGIVRAIGDRARQRNNGVALAPSRGDHLDRHLDGGMKDETKDGINHEKLPKGRETPWAFPPLPSALWTL